MHVRIEYGTQVRAASGLAEESVGVAAGESLAQLLAGLRTLHEPRLNAWLSESGMPRPGLLVFVNDQSAADYQAHALCDGDHVALMTLISGG